jgi:hypothetical protein
MQQHDLAELEQLTDDDLRRADKAVRTFWLRVYTLVAEASAPLDYAIKAVQSRRSRECRMTTMPTRARD